jgi:hypothetical protein
MAFSTGLFAAVLVISASLRAAVAAHDHTLLNLDKPHIVPNSIDAAGAANPNQRFFMISQWSDINCNTSQLWNTTAEAGVCVNLGSHSSNWGCPPISRNSGLRWANYASYSSADCSGTPTANHWNFCGECKQNILRECVDGVYINVYNCSDQECKVCPSPPTRITTTSCTSGSPLPQVQGLYLQLQQITTDVDSMYHQWWEGNGACQSSAVVTQKHGWDLIALEECNNGWLFQCL